MVSQPQYKKNFSTIYLCSIILSMDKLEKLTNDLVLTCKNYPITSISVSIITLLILILRKIHYRFIVYPQMGGRRNSQNSFGYCHPRQKKLDALDIQILVENNIKLRGWYIKHEKPQQIMIYFHQNAGNIGGRLYYVKELMAKSNTSVLLVAYRGFSDSDGEQKPRQSQIMKDAVAILKKGIEIAQQEKLPLFVFGRSLGGAAAIYSLSRPQLKYAAKGLILQNTFTNIYDVAANFIPKYLYPLRFLLWLITSNSYNSISRIKNIGVPILFIKGRKDTLVPARLMDKLQRQSERNKKNECFSLQVKNGTHNDTWYMAGNQYFDQINQFTSSLRN